MRLKADQRKEYEKRIKQLKNQQVIPFYDREINRIKSDLSWEHYADLRSKLQNVWKLKINDGIKKSHLPDKLTEAEYFEMIESEYIEDILIYTHNARQGLDYLEQIAVEELDKRKAKDNLKNQTIKRKRG